MLPTVKCKKIIKLTERLLPSEPCLSDPIPCISFTIYESKTLINIVFSNVYNY